ncbi:MAG TPA: hypothetical protein VL424_18525 [Pararobbsia sp.]|nr:hypothetical protein [Pararobbsia sp.]
MHPLDEYYIDTYAQTEEPVGPIDAPVIRCPMCGHELVIAYRRVGRRRYFKHADSRDDARCPLTTSSYQPEHNWIGRPFDPKTGPRVRARFLRLWQRHLQVMRHEAPGLSLRRLIELIAHADVVNVWSYPGMTEHHVPYVLLVLAGYLPYPDPKTTSMRVRFWFGDMARDLTDLWHEDGRVSARLFRVIYRPPGRTPLPVADDILRWEEVSMVERVADLAPARISRPEQRAFTRFLEDDRRKQGGAGAFDDASADDRNA